MIKIFIGFDSKEIAAYYVLAESIRKFSSEPISIAPLALNNLAGIFTRERHPLQSTEFSFSRFLVPFLCDYQGHAIFMDCDMLLRKDVAKLWELRSSDYAVQVVKHNYEPKSQIKFLNQPQSTYQKKNWSSLILFNNAQCKALTRDYVHNASGLDLHQFKWTTDSMIGALPAKWNHLVGEYEFDENAAIAHFTQGGPWWEEFKAVDYSSEWFALKDVIFH